MPNSCQIHLRIWEYRYKLPSICHEIPQSEYNPLLYIEDEWLCAWGDITYGCLNVLKAFKMMHRLLSIGKGKWKHTPVGQQQWVISCFHGNYFHCILDSCPLSSWQKRVHVGIIAWVFIFRPVNGPYIERNVALYRVKNSFDLGCVIINEQNKKN